MFQFITSLAPKTGGSQDEAIQSWLDLGCITIHSVNVASEVDVLKSRYPQVIFHEISENQTGLQEFGRPYVKLNALFSIALTIGDRIILLNSDLLLNPSWNSSEMKETLNIFWNRLGEFDLIHAHRLDFEGDNYIDVRGFYGDGIDIFAMNEKFMKCLPQTQFMLGQPWYDIFLPKWCNLKGLKSTSFNTELFLHRMHHSNWMNTTGYEILKKEYKRLLQGHKYRCESTYIGKQISVLDYDFIVQRTPRKPRSSSQRRQQRQQIGKIVLHRGIRGRIPNHRQQMNTRAVTRRHPTIIKRITTSNQRLIQGRNVRYVRGRMPLTARQLARRGIRSSIRR